MPLSIDKLSIKSEAQKVKLDLDSNDAGLVASDKHNEEIFMIKNLVEQTPITVF